MNKSLVGFLASFLFLFLVAGCRGVSSNRPAWVDQGSGFFSGDRGKAFYGVGAATGIKNVQLRRTSAETNARADLARSFKTRISDLVKIYMRHISGRPEMKGSEEQVNQQVTKAFTDMELAGVPVVAHHYEPGEDTEYALVMMDVAGMQSQISQMKQLSKQIQDATLKNSEDAFKELDEERMKNKE
jgi:hypothetical protein